MKMHSNGCNDLRYGLRYDEESDAVEFRYSFSNGIPFEDGSGIDFRPHAEIRRYHAPPGVLKNAEEGRRAASKMEDLFNREIGDAIRVAIQMLSHDVAARVGLLPVNEGEMGKKLAHAYIKDRSERLAIKSGPKRNSTWKQRRRRNYSNSKFLPLLNRTIRSRLDQEKPIDPQSIADELKIGSYKTLHRQRIKCGDDLKWPDRIAEASMSND
jgi:hypothetical protein